MRRGYREPRSWREVLDRCLDDHQRFRRMLLLVVVLIGFAFAVVVVAGWPVAGLGAVIACAIGRRRTGRA